MARVFPSLAFVAGLVLAVSTSYGQDYVYDVAFEGRECGGVISGAAGEVVRVNGKLIATYANKDVSSTTFVLGGTESDPSLNLSMDGPSCRTSCAVENAFGSDLTEDEKDIAGGVIFFNQFDGDATITANVPGVVYVLVLKPSTDPEEVPFTTFNAGRNELRDFYFDVTIPSDGSEQTITIEYRDGIETASPQTNEVIAEGTILTIGNGLDVPAACTFTVKEVQGGMIPGDADESNDVNALDAIRILEHYFIGDVDDTIPCGDGTIYDPGNVALLDWNDDGEVNIADAVGNLRKVFLGGTPHPLGDTCTTIAGCPALCF